MVFTEIYVLFMFLMMVKKMSSKKGKLLDDSAKGIWILCTSLLHVCIVFVYIYAVTLPVITPVQM